MEIAIAVVGLSVHSRFGKFLSGNSEVVNWEKSVMLLYNMVQGCLIES